MLTCPCDYLDNAFSITARTVQNVPVTQFGQPFVIEVAYEEVDLLGVEEDRLKLYFWGDESQSWVPVDTQVNMSANVVTARNLTI